MSDKDKQAIKKVDKTEKAVRKESFSQRLARWFTGDNISNDSTLLLADASKEVDDYKPIVSEKRFEIVKALGKGAFGIVYLAKDLRIGRLVAIKQLYTHFNESKEIYQRFIQEARIAGRLDNPNIVTIYDVEDQEAPTILMEYLGGGNLGTILRIDETIMEHTALIYLKGILNGLHEAHRMGVVHRDLKPENILFDHSGTPKISDFGVAHLPREAGGIDDSEKTEKVAGTPDYMAPEQFDPERTIDQRTDIFSCGVILYQMLTGHKVYDLSEASDLDAYGDIIRKSPLPTMKDFPDEISMAVREMCLKMMAREPIDRYQNARSVIEDIEDIIGSNAQNSINATGRTHSYQEMYQDILRLFLVDGIVSPAERRDLVKRADRLNIEPVQARMLEEKVRSELNLPLIKHLQAYEFRVQQLLKDLEYSPEASCEYCI